MYKGYVDATRQIIAIQYQAKPEVRAFLKSPGCVGFVAELLGGARFIDDLPESKSIYNKESGAWQVLQILKEYSDE